MNHQEFIKEVPQAKTAFIFVHGILGTPDHFDELIPLVPDTCSVYNLLLDGHGKEVRDFARSSMDNWRAQVESVFDCVSRRYDRVVFVGHSMGTLFAIRMAVKYPEKIPFIFLLASPMRVGLRPVMVENALRVALSRIHEDDPLQVATRNACSIRPDSRLYPYASWIPRFLELFREIRRTEKLLPKLTVPAYALQSHMDEMVSRKTARVLEDNRVEVTILRESSHFYYPAQDKAQMHELFTAACNLHLNSK